MTSGVAKLILKKFLCKVLAKDQIMFEGKARFDSKAERTR
jgi:hypothetical protein